MSTAPAKAASHRKMVNAAYRDIHAMAKCVDIIADLDEPDRRRVMQWLNEKFPAAGTTEPSANSKTE